ncbi:TetR/AcrR family transcriptional regulator [Loigolactobacillus bifermentans]|uniref:TetR family transcriptional regulator n=1 Tax=Loigolactobacillus bifermentans DSM 20003 TaxID=1423726 RepID=A0A0R1GY65_9LACO|nr:TetR/AcrR family transcriptional regulator [Loigolactobacillus bifermentans]KRK39109.1 TetR family transcriptional regulator [Loigolactobacillus bifermentans DSM 20003]QGG59004.1 TetR family transcriptional regulator [Loigolactobacillus bifermentans]
MAVNTVETLFNTSLAASELSPKQQAVLQACLKLFAEKGFERTSTADIAQEAGVAEGTVYKHFKTKQAILEALLKPLVTSVVPKVATEFITEIKGQQFVTLTDFLTFIVKDRLAFVVDNRRVIHIFVQQVLVRPALLEAGYQLILNYFEQDLGAEIQTLKQQKQLVDWPLPRILRLVVGTVVSYTAPVIVMPAQAFDLDQATREIVAFLSKGLAA